MNGLRKVHVVMILDYPFLDRPPIMVCNGKAVVASISRVCTAVFTQQELQSCVNAARIPGDFGNTRWLSGGCAILKSRLLRRRDIHILHCCVLQLEHANVRL